MSGSHDVLQEGKKKPNLAESLLKIWASEWVICLSPLLDCQRKESSYSCLTAIVIARPATWRLLLRPPSLSSLHDERKKHWHNLSVILIHNRASLLDQDKDLPYWDARTHFKNQSWFEEGVWSPFGKPWWCQSGHLKNIHLNYRLWLMGLLSRKQKRKKKPAGHHANGSPWPMCVCQK